MDTVLNVNEMLYLFRLIFGFVMKYIMNITISDMTEYVDSSLPLIGIREQLGKK